MVGRSMPFFRVPLFSPDITRERTQYNILLEIVVGNATTEMNAFK